MAHLSPPPSPPVQNSFGQFPFSQTTQNDLQRASAFNSVLQAQKWNPRGNKIFSKKKFKKKKQFIHYLKVT